MDVRRPRVVAFIALLFGSLAAGSLAAARKQPDPGEERGFKFLSAADVARLFEHAADTSRFLTAAPGGFDALAHRLRDRGNRPLVVVQYGDSHTQAGVLARDLRDQLAGGGVTSPGFVAPGLHNLGDASCATRGRWKRETWLKPGDEGSFGPLGMAFVTRDPHARAILRLPEPSSSGMTVTALYSRAAGHLPFRISAGGRVLSQVAEEAPAGGAGAPILGSVRITLPDGTSELELAIAPGPNTGHDLRLFGFLVQKPGAAVEWDALGVNGTSVEHPLQRADRSLEEYLALRQPDLILVWFGSNSLVAPTFEPASYGRDYAAFLHRLAAAAPGAARLALGPPDLARRPPECPAWYGHGRRHLSQRDRALLPQYICTPETAIIHRPHHPDLYPVRSIHTAAEWADYMARCSPQTLPTVATATAAERDAAQAEGYAFFDTFAFMDGAGSIHRWACQTPRLGAYDLVHLTADGYTTVAEGVWGALPATIRSPALASSDAVAAPSLVGKSALQPH
jgi:lysophospholipase L1-like esterase